MEQSQASVVGSPLPLMLVSLLLALPQARALQELTSMQEMATLQEMTSLQEVASLQGMGSLQGQVYMQDPGCATVGSILQELAAKWMSCYTDNKVEQLSGSQVLLLRDENTNPQDLDIEADEDLQEPEEEMVDIENITFEEDSDEFKDALEVIDEFEEVLEVTDELEEALEVIDELEEGLEVIEELEETLEGIDADVTQDIDGKESVEQTDVEEEIIIEVPKEDVVDLVEILAEEDGIIDINEEIDDLEDLLEEEEANEEEEIIAVVFVGEEDDEDTKEEVAEEYLAEEEEDKPIADIEDLEK